ncbi:RNA polymerase II Elongator subunit [Hortaea werneckii]|nr:RNA polymerase II Elongator subunit [Hortaea werneckii]KAI7315782.1 RNA polymerase II Elongator subunit [Hortaea werneckii]
MSAEAAPPEFLAAGGNRHSSAADWTTGLLAFGAGHNLALWNPQDNDERNPGVVALLAGHTGHINAVKIFDDLEGRRCIITGATDKTVRVWRRMSGSDDRGVPASSFEETDCLAAHEGSVNTIAVLAESGTFVTGSADGTVKVWQFSMEGGGGGKGAEIVQSIALKPRCIPLTVALASLADGTVVLAVGGTASHVQLYSRTTYDEGFQLQATLTGHEGWIRTLDFARKNEDELLLASGSQDKYIRLWRFQRGAETGEEDSRDGAADLTLALSKKSLSNKAHHVGSPNMKYKVSFEALLIGHEDWVYTARWAPATDSKDDLTLLSASADNSLSFWKADDASGVWVCETRLGEISAQKGSTSATGSTGGFWIGLWQPDGKAVASLGRTGSWRRWKYDPTGDSWVQQVGISGHTKEVQSLAWSPDGSYLLTTSLDQTTRLFAEWKRNGQISWHEIARPQIHGYDLNCIDSLGANQFVSGADEKLLRVFNKPKATDHLLSKLSGTASNQEELPDAANIPVLGLSNKAIAAVGDDEGANGVVEGEGGEQEDVDPASVLHKSTLDLGHPPFEDHLARHTLWPEHEKLYGHGYEISAVAASHDGALVATACKATSIDHAVIRIYETKEWREVKPPLSAHSLTVTSLAFSADDKYLLSVGRDRQWAIFERGEQTSSTYKSLVSDPKGHSRMILDCSWAPSQVGYVFATAGRDKSVKIWRLETGKAECITTVAADAPVTAIAFALSVNAGSIDLAMGMENGKIKLVRLDAQSLQVGASEELAKSACPSAAVNCLRWRPGGGEGHKQLAVAGEDNALRIVSISN